MRRPNRGMFKVFSYTLAIVMLVSFLPGNMSSKPLDFSGFGEGIVQVVKSIGKAISDIDIPFDFGGDNKDAPEPPPSEKVVVQVDPDKDTEIKSPSEKITLKIPKGAVTKQSEIEFIEYAPTGSTGMVMLNRFELNAREKDTGTLFSKFSKSLEITIKHDPAELAGLDIASLRLYSLNEKTKQWVPVSTGKYDSKTNTIRATVDHFSNYGEFANPTIVGPGKVMAAQVSLGSGTATFSYPFELPPGPGGFTPKLELTYNSGSADEMKNKQAVGSWVGIGWSLHLGRISYDASTTQYSLDLNGASYKLTSSDGINFRTNPEEYFKVTRNAINGNTWEVLNKEGNYYRFGGTTDSQQYYYNPSVQIYYRWDLNLIKDTNNNQATVTYIQDIREYPEFSPGQFVRSAYPENLTYGNIVVHFTSSYDGYDASWDGNIRKDNPKSFIYIDEYWGICIVNLAPKVMENKKLDSIEIKVSGNLIRKYSFSYNTTDCVLSGDYGSIYYSGKHTLTSVTQVGANGTSQLPSMTFNYGDLQIHRHTNETSYSGNPGNPANLYWPHLTAVNSGYGGSISFSYTQIPSVSTANIWTREVVTAKTINSGVGDAEAYTYTYTGNPQYLRTSWDQEYRGFVEIKETDAVGSYTKHWFYTTGNIGGKDAEKLSGREYKTQWYNSVNTLLREETYDWDFHDTSQIQDVVSVWTDYNGLSYPYLSNIDISDSGNVYAVYSDYYNPYVLKYEEHGSFILKFGSYGYDNGQFLYPNSVAVDNNGYVYVLDYLDDGLKPTSIQKFDPNGNFILKWWYSWGSGNGEFDNPRGIAVDSNGYIYVTDAFNRRIQKFSSNGTFILKWGSQGTGDGQFNNPSGVAVDSSGNVYVADTGNNRIQKFSSNGTFILKWGTQGTGNGQFKQPFGVDIDSNGAVYVADSENHRIQKFDSSGTFIRKWGSQGTKSGEFYWPRDVAVSPHSVYVADTNNYRIQEFTNNWAIRLNKVEETIGDKTTRTEYVYDDYGNVVTEKVHGDISTNTDDVTIWRTYYPNTTANILSKVARERVYATIVTEDNGGSNLKKETLYYYDGNNTSLTTPPTKGMLTRVESKKNASTSVSGYTTYDTYGNVLTTTDANGNVTTITWDATYHTYPATQTFPITGLTESYTYDPGTNNVLSVIDVNGQTTTYQYDTFKRAVKVIKPGDTAGSPSMEFQYNNWGTINQQHLKTLTKISEGNYVWQSQYFDGLGRVVQVQSNGETGHTIISGTTVFNNRGLVDKQYVTQDLLSSQVNGYKAPETGWKYNTATYDGLGRAITQTNADGTTIGNDYSTAWKVAVTNPRGFIARYYYDAFGRLVKVEEPNESNGVYATTNYTYDTLGNLIQVLDASNNTTSMSYDWLSRKTAMTDPDMGSWSYGYDNNGNLTSQTDAKNQTISMVYDALNRLTNKNYPAGSGMTNVVYAYDSTSGGNYGKGLRTGMTDAAGTNSYKYDTRGRLVEEKKTIDAVNYITGYTYDGLARAVTVAYPTGETVTNTYNGRGLPNTVSGSVAGSLVTSTLYNQLGAMTEINLNNVVKTTYGYYGTGGTYDTSGGYHGRLWEIKSAKQSTTLQDIKHTWDATGNLTQRQDLVSSETENFTYDFLDRLTGVSGAYTQSYTYNTIGNITAMNGNSYTYGTKPHAATVVGSTNYAYDSNGNMTTRGTQTIGLDVENRVVSVSGNASFVYDGDGNRVKKTENGQTILYINQYYEKNLTTGVVTTYYYLGGKLVAQREGTTLRYIHQDSLTSTSLTTDSSGSSVGNIKYFPFGSARSSSGALPAQKFTGQRLDDTGLYYYGARYYDAGIGRFISADTVVQSFSNPQTLNRYSYCVNNPLKYTDPSGHRFITEEDWSVPQGDPPPPPPPKPPKKDEPDLPLEKNNDKEDGIQTELITCDIITLGGDIIGTIPTPITFIVGWFISTGASTTGYLLTYNDAREGRASEEDVQIARTNTIVGLIPGVGVVTSFNQLVYDMKLTWGPWKEGRWDWDATLEWLEIPEEWYK